MPALPRGWKLAAGVAALVAGLVAISLLAIRGVPGPAAPSPMSAPKVQSAQPAPQNAPGLDVMAQRLAARLEAGGSANAGDWELLARSYVELRRPAEAVKPFAQARKLRGDGDAQLLADYADALLASNGQRVDPLVRELVAGALKADPANAKARSLAAGIAQGQAAMPAPAATAQPTAPPSGADPSWMPQSMKGPKAAGR